MITPFAIVLLLGATSVLGEGLSCELLQQIIIKNGKFAPGDPAATIKPSFFQNRVDIQRPRQQNKANTPKYLFPVKYSGVNLPQITVDKMTYKLYSYAAMPLPVEGAGSLLLGFHSASSNNAGVTVVVPIIMFSKWVPNLNEDLNEDLHELGRLSQHETDRTDVSIAFVEPLLKDAIRLRSSTRKIFMVDCEKISEDDVINYLK